MATVKKANRKMLSPKTSSVSGRVGSISKAQKGKMVPSEMFPGKMIPKANRDSMSTGMAKSLNMMRPIKSTPTIPAKPKKNTMKSGGTLSPTDKSVGKTIGKLNKAKSGTMMKKKKAMGGMSVTRLANMKKGGAKKTTMKSGGKMKKCAYGCK